MKVSHPGVRQTLAACGPLTSREIAAFFPSSSHADVSAMISSMRRLATKQVYIHAWVRENDYGRDYLRAVYALGNERDAPKPRAMTNAERCRRHKARRALPRAANSVFTWAAAQA